MKNAFYFIIIFLSFLNTELFGQKKWSLGLGVQTFRSEFLNIKQELNTAYNENNEPDFTYLAPYSKQPCILSYGAHFTLERSIKCNTTIDFGLGLLKTKNDIFLDYTPDKSQTPNPYNSVNMHRNYIYLPMNFNYLARLASNLRLKTSLGVTTNFLFHIKDNFISWLEVGYLKYDQYSKVNILGRAKMGLVYEKEDMQTVETNLFINYGLTPATVQTYPFLVYDVLNSANEIQFGIEVNYFFCR